MICSHKNFYRIFIVLFFLHSNCFAQSSGDPVDSVITVPVQDSALTDYEDIGDTVITRFFFENNNDSILKWKKSREFGYMAYLDSLLRRNKNDLKTDTFSFDKSSSRHSKKINISGDDNSNSFLNSFPIKIFFWLIAIAFILFILYRLFFKGGLFAKEAKKYIDDSASDEPEKLNEYSEYNELINNAESKMDYNLAIRYLYLQVLKKLSEREMIVFAPDKTNNKYLEELSGTPYQIDFRSLTHNYEYVWYGKFSISRGRYEGIKQQFILFNKTI
jgi:hypothetical protein